MSTQTELLERQEQATDQLELLKGLLHQFIHGEVIATVTTEAGAIPTLAGLIEEIRQRVGLRRNPINYSVYDLLRYEDEAEPLFTLVNDIPLWFEKNLTGSYFRLTQAPSGADIELELDINGTVFTITFVSGETTGAVTGVEEDVVIPAGSLIQLKLKGASLAAKGLAMTLVGLVEAPEAP